MAKMSKIIHKEEIKNNEKDNNNNLNNSSVKYLEHSAGFLNLMRFVSSKIKNGAKIKVEDDIIILDAVASEEFFIGRPYTNKKTNYDKNGEQSDIIITSNPYIVCTSDFLSFINWDKIYIIGQYLYLISLNTVCPNDKFKTIKPFALGIYIDNPSKFNVFNNFSHIDVKNFQSGYNEKTDNFDKLIVPNNEVTKTIEFYFNKKFQDVLNLTSMSGFEKDKANYLKRMKSKKMMNEKGEMVEVDTSEEFVGNYYSEHAGLLNYYANLERAKPNEYTGFEMGKFVSGSSATQNRKEQKEKENKFYQKNDNDDD